MDLQVVQAMYEQMCLKEEVIDELLDDGHDDLRFSARHCKRMNWTRHVLKLIHEKSFERKYQMSYEAFIGLLNIYEMISTVTSAGVIRGVSLRRAYCCHRSER
jgi:hypothetical protein